MKLLPALLLTPLAWGAEMPPSPSEAPGTKIWPAPAFAQWPAVVHPGETRHAVVDLPVRVAGGTGVLTWAGRTMSLIFPVAEGWSQDQEPPGTPTVGALVVLPTSPGTAIATTEGGSARVRLVDAREPWPQAGLVQGRAVDADGVPVVLVDRPHNAVAERRFAWLASAPVHPEGPPVLVGDDLGGALADLPGVRSIPRTDPRGAAHPALVALAQALTAPPWPRTIAWSPGPVALTAPADEDRVLGAVAHRCQALGIAPRLLLILPECPPDHPDEPRRQALAQAAAARGWRVTSVDTLAGAGAARLAPGVWAHGPVGEARERLRQGLVPLLAIP